VSTIPAANCLYSLIFLWLLTKILRQTNNGIQLWMLLAYSRVYFFLNWIFVHLILAYSADILYKSYSYGKAQWSSIVFCAELLATKFSLCTEYRYLTHQPIRGQCMGEPCVKPVIHRFSWVEKSGF
jgi:hypothetical protein